MNQDDPIQVAIVDDHSIVRRGLGAILTTNDQLKLVGEAENGQEAIELCELAQPDVVLMDLIMPRIEGLGVSEDATWQQKILKLSPGDILVMYTDGITEAHNRDGAFFSGTRLHESIRRNKQLLAAELLEAIFAEGNEFTLGASDQDDMALVVLSRKV
jgi:CheY-like chemotaxis protein